MDKSKTAMVCLEILNFFWIISPFDDWREWRQQSRPQTKFVQCTLLVLENKIVRILHATVVSHYITGRACKGESTEEAE